MLTAMFLNNHTHTPLYMVVCVWGGGGGEGGILRFQLELTCWSGQCVNRVWPPCCDYETFYLYSNYIVCGEKMHH